MRAVWEGAGEGMVKCGMHDGKRWQNRAVVCSVTGDKVSVYGDAQSAFLPRTLENVFVPQDPRLSNGPRPFLLRRCSSICRHMEFFLQLSTLPFLFIRDGKAFSPLSIRTSFSSAEFTCPILDHTCHGIDELIIQKMLV